MHLNKPLISQLMSLEVTVFKFSLIISFLVLFLFCMRMHPTPLQHRSDFQTFSLSLIRVLFFKK